ncbi:MAG: hypothetical protein II161_02195, partial [Erysipelotrichaceae bacterium]|nr:hypothetical protein [Erysipelotrichaceae bacterium]
MKNDLYPRIGSIADEHLGKPNLIKHSPARSIIADLNVISPGAVGLAQGKILPVLRKAFGHHLSIEFIKLLETEL